jgi:hypothetical protein
VKKKVAFQLTDVDVTKSCIRQRIQKKITSAKHCGTKSPAAELEEYIVSILQQMAKMRQPLNVSEGLNLANALVDGTEWEQKVTEFKLKRGWKPYAVDGKKKPILGPSWYKGFWKCHAFSWIGLSGPYTAIFSKCMMKFTKQWKQQE